MTTLLISHRPRVIQRADWLVVLEQGRVIMQGSLQELSTQSGSHLHFLHP
jgi:ATP-binding cassette subfamily C protein